MTTTKQFFLAWFLSLVVISLPAEGISQEIPTAKTNVSGTSSNSAFHALQPDENGNIHLVRLDGNTEMLESALADADDLEFARNLIGELNDDLSFTELLSQPEARHVIRLSTATRSAKLSTFRQALADPDSALRAGGHMTFLLKAAVGLDPKGEFSNDILHEVLEPVFANSESSPETITTACKMLEHLPVIDANIAAEMVWNRMLREAAP